MITACVANFSLEFHLHAVYLLSLTVVQCATGGKNVFQLGRDCSSVVAKSCQLGPFAWAGGSADLHHYRSSVRKDLLTEAQSFPRWPSVQGSTQAAPSFRLVQSASPHSHQVLTGAATVPLMIEKRQHSGVVKTKGILYWFSMTHRDLIVPKLADQHSSCCTESQNLS